MDETELKLRLDGIFNKYDSDHNGVLDEQELRLMFHDINNSHKYNLPKNDVDAYVRAILNTVKCSD